MRDSIRRNKANEKAQNTIPLNIKNQENKSIRKIIYE